MIKVPRKWQGVSRGTPRLANRLLKRVRDFAQVKYDGVITEDVANTALNLLEVDKLGLDRGDRSILDTIISKFAGGPVGLDTLAVAFRGGFRYSRGCLRALPYSKWINTAYTKRSYCNPYSL